MIDLMYCAGGNPRLSHIAHEEGWLLGFRSDKHMGDFPVCFIDVEYRKPDFEKHLEVVEQWKPKYATVPDLSEHSTNMRQECPCIKIPRLHSLEGGASFVFFHHRGS